MKRATRNVLLKALVYLPLCVFLSVFAFGYWHWIDNYDAQDAICGALAIFAVSILVCAAFMIYTYVTESKERRERMGSE